MKREGLDEERRKKKLLLFKVSRIGGLGGSSGIDRSWSLTALVIPSG